VEDDDEVDVTSDAGVEEDEAELLVTVEHWTSCAAKAGNGVLVLAHKQPMMWTTAEVVRVLSWSCKPSSSLRQRYSQQKA
jgi:hypothetical protein